MIFREESVLQNILSRLIKIFLLFNFYAYILHFYKNFNLQVLISFVSPIFFYS